MIPYLTILGVALLGALSAPWLSLFVGAAILAYIALRNQRQYQQRFATLGLSGLLETAAYASVAHAILAAAAAYALGIVARLIFLTS